MIAILVLNFFTKAAEYITLSASLTYFGTSHTSIDGAHSGRLSLDYGISADCCRFECLRSREQRRQRHHQLRGPLNNVSEITEVIPHMGNHYRRLHRQGPPPNPHPLEQ